MPTKRQLMQVYGTTDPERIKEIKRQQFLSAVEPQIKKIIQQEN